MRCLLRPVTALLLAFAIAAAVALPARAQGSLIDNGDFERAGESADQIPGWSSYVWDGDGHVSHMRATRFAGERAAAIEGSGPGKIAIFQELQAEA